MACTREGEDSATRGDSEKGEEDPETAKKDPEMEDMDEAESEAATGYPEKAGEST